MSACVRACVNERVLPLNTLETRNFNNPSIKILKELHGQAERGRPSRTDTVVEHYTQNIDHQLILDLAGYKEG